MTTTIVDEDLGMASETCVSMHPEAFRIGESGYVEVQPDEKELTDEERRAVVSSCPVGALRLG
ncbi:(4Fe-4S)-binding protein [Pseudonocardia sp.]|jgi:ferredoxin|uniref:(4Fe-4S)-binding protein n=1 Tax=Pseudonocardia sp. TaxID=60912 RepID=UPI0031FC1F5B